MYLPFRASWQMVIRPCTPFPPPPLRFRTASFPQYGSKQVVNRDLRTAQRLAYTRPQSRSPRRAFCSVMGLSSKRHAQLLTQRTCPVALGSPAPVPFLHSMNHLTLTPAPLFRVFRVVRGCTERIRAEPNDFFRGHSFAPFYAFPVPISGIRAIRGQNRTKRTLATRYPPRILILLI